MKTNIRSLRKNFKVFLFEVSVNLTWDLSLTNEFFYLLRLKKTHQQKWPNSLLRQ